SPPLGGFMPTGHRQTTVPLPPGSAACFFTDGLVEARLGDGLLGRERLAEIAGDLDGHAPAEALLVRIAEEADRAPDDMAACIVRATDDARQAAGTRVEDLELEGGSADEERAHAFLTACGMPEAQVATALRSASGAVAEFGGAILRVHLDGAEGRAEVVPREPTLGLTANGSNAGDGTADFSTPHISL
ncbi:MAG TPA: SpoIIE family protein phosphatase, partial [Thermoleophilaceae bacterium]